MTQNPQTMTDILDLKDIAPLDLSWVWIVVAILTVFVVIGLVVLAYYLWKGLRRASKIKQTPLQIALQKLEELTNSRLIESGQVRRFYFGLSDLYREFIEKELHLMACETTLEELRPQLKSSPELSADDVRDALWLLELFDMAKFAKWVPPQEDIAHSIELSRAWMERVARAHQERLKGQPAPASGGAR